MALPNFARQQIAFFQLYHILHSGALDDLTRYKSCPNFPFPIHTWADWDEDRPGCVKVDLVGRDGGALHGDYCLILTATNVKTGWTECVTTPNKAPKHVFAALRAARAWLPFPLRGIDSDNDSEFICLTAEY